MIKANSFWKYYTTGVTKTAPTDSLDAIQWLWSIDWSVLPICKIINGWYKNSLNIERWSCMNS